MANAPTRNSPTSWAQSLASHGGMIRARRRATQNHSARLCCRAWSA